MDIKNIPKSYFGVAIIFLSFILLSDYIYVTSNQKFKSVNVYSGFGDGLSIFRELNRRISGNDIVISKNAFLDKIDPEVSSMIMIISPKKSISIRESEILKTYVEDGGSLFLSLVNRNEQEIFKDLFINLKIADEIIENPNFINKQVELVNANNESEYLLGGEEYSFYSSLIFNKNKNNNPGKYFRDYKFGKGRVYLNLGLPVFSNGLIERSDNRNFVFELIAKNNQIIIDEYRHDFLSKTFVDLILEASFTLPLLGMMLLMVIFLVFSNDTKTSYHYLNQKTDLNYHKLNSEIIHGIWVNNKMRSGALYEHAQRMIRLFPTHQKKIYAILNSKHDNQIDEISAKMQLLVKLHQEILNDKGIRII